ncbi:MAG: Cu2+-exporting ATPase, partial [bacterium]
MAEDSVHDVEKITLPIQGMTCASCVARVEKALNSVKGVVKATVNLATEKATVEYSPGIASVRELKRTVKDSGYKVLDVEEKDLVEKEKALREAEFKKLRNKLL